MIKQRPNFDQLTKLNDLDERVLVQVLPYLANYVEEHRNKETLCGRHKDA